MIEVFLKQHLKKGLPGQDVLRYTRCQLDEWCAPVTPFPPAGGSCTMHNADDMNFFGRLTICSLPSSGPARKLILLTLGRIKLI